MGFDRYTSYTEHGQRKPGQKMKFIYFLGSKDLAQQHQWMSGIDFSPK
jgi:hypothetical protein